MVQASLRCLPTAAVASAESGDSQSGLSYIKAEKMIASRNSASP